MVLPVGIQTFINFLFFESIIADLLYDLLVNWDLIEADDDSRTNLIGPVVEIEPRVGLHLLDVHPFAGVGS